MVLVVGATGSLGGKIVRELIGRGESVRVLSRRTSNYQPLVEAGAEVVFGDLKDPPSLDRACEGVDVVVSSANSAKRGGEDNVENVDLRGNQALIEAARRAGVKRLVFVSALGASEDSPVPLLRAKARTEAALRESGVDYTILSPTVFMDVWFPALVEMPVLSGEPVTLVGESRRRHSFVAERDIAAIAAAAVRSPEARNTTIPIGGPEALTFRDVVDHYQRAAEREIPVRSVAPGERIPGLPEPVSDLAQAFETYDSPVPMQETARRYGVELTSAEDFARGSNLARARRD